MATVTVSPFPGLSLNSEVFWIDDGKVINKTESNTFEYSFVVGPSTFYVRVTGSSFTYNADGDPAGGSYNTIAVFGDSTRTFKLAEYNSSQSINFATYFTSGAKSGFAFSDTLTGTSNNDFIVGHGGADILNGADATDFYGFFNGDVAAGESINDTGPSGQIDWILILDSAVDFRGAATITGIELLSFVTPVFSSLFINPAVQGAIFNASRLPANLVVGGDLTGVDKITITNASNFSAAGWFFQNWSANDVISITGTSGNDTIGGSSQNDILRGGVGADTQNGAIGNDTFQIFGSEGLGDTFQGSTGTDKVQVLGASATILSGFNAAASSIEQWQGNNQGLFGTSAANTFNFAGLTSKTGLPFVDGGGGNDAITGSQFTDDLRGNIGNDTLLGNAGNDILRGGVGADAQNGGIGNDIFQIAGSEGLGDSFSGGTGTDKIQVLGTGTTTLSGFNAPISSVEQWQGNGKGLFGTSAANTFNFAALTSKTGLPFIDGGGGNDAITGSQFADDLRGNIGNDTLNGYLGNDILTGGLGRDILRGSTGADRFDFNLISESPVGSLRDQILDFTRSQFDKIDLAGIDANTKVAGNNAFKFIGTQGFHKVAGELRASSGIVQGDVNGDAKADFEIKVNVATFIASDFVL